jgi:predicted  nucleic acid-binding Zn-ribbon protein
MAKVPAICRKCGLVFPSFLEAFPGLVAEQNIQGCPRCGTTAFVLDGYTEKINGLIVFITSPDYTLRQKQTLIKTADAVARGQIASDDAVRKLETQNKEAGRILREWVILGATVVMALTAVATLVLDYHQRGGNSPLFDVAVDKFEEVLVTSPQADRRSLPETGALPIAGHLKTEPPKKNEMSATSNTDPPYENRKSRRARIKQSLSKKK